MWKDKRSGKLALVAHCILNQNSRVLGLAEKSTMSIKIVDFLLKNGLSIIQMPCPEMTYAGLTRQPQTKEQYDTAIFRRHCRKIAENIAGQIQEYEKNGIKLKIVLGVHGSPSCGAGQDYGVFMDELKNCLHKRRIRSSFYEVNFKQAKNDIPKIRRLIQ